MLTRTAGVELGPHDITRGRRRPRRGRHADQQVDDGRSREDEDARRGHPARPHGRAGRDRQRRGVPRRRRCRATSRPRRSSSTAASCTAAQGCSRMAGATDARRRRSSSAADSPASRARSSSPKHGVHVTLVDRHNYNQFQPLLYQVATAQVNVDRRRAAAARDLPQARPRRREDGRRSPSVDPAAKTVTSADGVTFAGDYLVLAMGSEPNFFDTPGAEEHAFPLYSLDDAERLRSRLLTVFEDADRNPKLIDQGALNFVIVGAGATGVETAGALADCINHVIPAPDARRAGSSRADDPPGRSRARSCSHRSPSARTTYAAKVLEKTGVQLELGVKVDEVAADRVVLSDGREILTRTVVWAGGIQAAELAATLGHRRRRTAGGSTSAPTSSVAGVPGRVRARRRRQHARTPTASRSRSSGRWRCRPAAARPTTSSPTSTGSTRSAVPLPRQGHHGDDRPQRGRRRGRPTPPRAARPRSRTRRGSACTPGCSAASASASTRSGRGRGTTSPSTRASAIIDRPDATQHRLGRVAPCARASARENVASAASPRSSWLPGGLDAVFTPGLGMTGVSLRYARRGAPRPPGRARRAARRSDRRASRCSHRGRTDCRRGATAPRASPSISTDSTCRRRRQRAADPRVPRRRGRAGRSTGSRPAATPPALRASIAVDAPAFPFPHRIEVTAIVARRRAPRRHDDRPDRSPGVPIAFGWHPYLRLPGRASQRWRLRLPRRRHLALDTRGIPTGDVASEARPSRR